MPSPSYPCRLPRLPNGKVDHAAVARPRGVAGHGAPRSTSADALTALYGAVLRRQRWQPTDTFAGSAATPCRTSSSRCVSKRRARPAAGRTGLGPHDRRPRGGPATRRGARSRRGRLDTGILLRARSRSWRSSAATPTCSRCSAAPTCCCAVAGANFAPLPPRAAPTGANARRNLVRVDRADRGADRDCGWRRAADQRPVRLAQHAAAQRRARAAHLARAGVALLVHRGARLLLAVAAGALTAIPRRGVGAAVAVLVRRRPGRRRPGPAVLGDGERVRRRPHPLLVVRGLAVRRRAGPRRGREHAGHRVLLSALLVVGDASASSTTRSARRRSPSALLAWSGCRRSGCRGPAIAVVGQVAGASLYIYLTHWQVYPHLEHRWPLGGLLASLLVGIAVWRLVDLISDRGSPSLGAAAAHEPPLDTPARRPDEPHPSRVAPGSRCPCASRSLPPAARTSRSWSSTTPSTSSC